MVSLRMAKRKAILTPAPEIVAVGARSYILHEYLSRPCAP